MSSTYHTANIIQNGTESGTRMS